MIEKFKREVKATSNKDLKFLNLDASPCHYYRLKNPRYDSLSDHSLSLEVDQTGQHGTQAIHTWQWWVERNRNRNSEAKQGRKVCKSTTIWLKLWGRNKNSCYIESWEDNYGIANRQSMRDNVMSYYISPHHIILYHII